MTKRISLVTKHLFPASFGKLVFIFALLSVVGPQIVYADSVYRWTDPSGNVNYSSKPPSSDAKPADLPPIMRGEVKLTKTAAVTCREHGGDNCQAGADEDGSVVCFDGFKGATTRFRFSCMTPKLEIADLSEVGTKGNFTVFVRNSKSVAANKASVSFAPEGSKPIQLIGPEIVEPFGTAEYTFSPSANADFPTSVSPGEIQLACENCPN